MKRRSPTPPRARTRLDAQTEAVLHSATVLQQSTQIQTQAAMGQADAAYQAAKQAISEMASIRRTIEAALTAQFQHQTALTSDQVTQLAKETSSQWQGAVQAQQQLQARLRDQQAETERLRAELQNVQISQSSGLQELQQ